ncbi:hypothetical protein [Acidomonas methanolica]|uniref:Uncharacterized protein n=1 Tax=Acidomonas methanolica NBRC 104435 TaxID=1231351 RepID=A0A023D6G5_ACIMT|nr:hypothetical protein [Acidomonas methanolica]TCS24105.1 hypothetical protein EDC31_12526 [Acidomonas methanolica]GAJ29743.1 hypothetical protein Amme_076_036 [Acidomonas methanolica NBRC 104435]GBQ59406.1 hypothetical protein AA0498_2745 [Acidomonas methanolica]GEL00020.1 hypothetical protein AME01nite_25180 [Acidomonas methanolica NBRC 104435]
MSASAVLDPRLDDHERRISNVEASLRDFSTKMAEMHGENRARMDRQDFLLAEGFREVRGDLKRLGSIQHWIVYTVVVSTAVFCYASGHLAGWLT